MHGQVFVEMRVDSMGAFHLTMEALPVHLVESEVVPINGCEWQEWLKINESRHDFIKNNLLNATLTFPHRVKMFIKHIIKSKGSPLKVKYHSYKVVFAMRGAAHVHGVLWIDWENIDILSKDDTRLIKDALKKIKNEQKI